MRTILCYAKPYRWKIIRAVAVKFGGSMVELLIPWILSALVDDIIPRKNPALVCLYGGLMLVAGFLAWGMNVGANRLAAGASRRITQDLRDALFRRVTQLSARQFQALTLPSLVSRVTADSYHVHQFIGMMMRMGVRAPILVVGGVAMSIVLDPVLSLAIFIPLPFMILLLVTVQRMARPLFVRTQALTDEIVRVVRDDLAGIRVIKAFGKEAEENNRFRQANEKAARKDRQAGQVTAVLNPGMNLLLNLGMVLVIVLGAYRVQNGQTMPGRLIAMLSYMTLILNGMMFLSRFFRMYSKASASAQRMEEVLELEPEQWELEPETEKKAKPDRKAHIVFDNVSFSYGKTGVAALDRISFTVARGTTLGIIGPTGSGKSTMVRLLLGFYPPDSGRILVDGTDIRRMDQKTLRRRFGAALQNDHLFQVSMEENICLGRPVTGEQMQDALRDAQADQFVREKGLSNRLDIRGANLSGGQKQRIMLARALAVHPDILILDDASSALDYATDARFRAALLRRRQESTVILVAQRISSIMDAEQILVLKEGRMAGLGTHNQLLETCPLYREIYEIQMGTAEHKNSNGTDGPREDLLTH